MMVEAEATEKTIELVAGGATAPTEEVVAQGLEAAKPFIAALCRRAGRAGRARPPSRPRDFPLFLDYQDDVYAAVEAARRRASWPQALTIAGKQEREDATDALKDEVKAALAGQFEGREKEISGAFRSLTKKLVRQRILRDKVRIDGRGLTDIRPLSAEVEVAAAGARLGAVRARRDPDPGRHHAEHARHGAEAGHALAGRPASATCTTTTSRRTRPVRPAGSARRSAARSATARWPSGR